MTLLCLGGSAQAQPALEPLPALWEATVYLSNGCAVLGGASEETRAGCVCERHIWGSWRRQEASL